MPIYNINNIIEDTIVSEKLGYISISNSREEVFQGRECMNGNPLRGKSPKGKTYLENIQTLQLGTGDT